MPIYPPSYRESLFRHTNQRSLFSNKPVSSEFELHATGDADLNGRKYVALPKGTELTDKVRKQYNIM